MKRTKPAPSSKKKQNSGEIKDEGRSRVTKDGRVLGTPMEEYVPEKFRNCVPEQTPYDKFQYKKQSARNVNRIARTLMPLSLQPDDDIDFAGRAARIRGMSQARFNTLVAAFRVGMNSFTACKMAGISTSTLQNWKSKAANGVWPYTALMAAIDEADAEYEYMLLEQLYTAATKMGTYTEETEETFDGEDGEIVTKKKKNRKKILPKWAAAAWLLERKNPAYRLDNQEQQQDEHNTGQQDLLMMDATSTGQAVPAPEGVTPDPSVE